MQQAIYFVSVICAEVRANLVRGLWVILTSIVITFGCTRAIKPQSLLRLGGWVNYWDFEKGMSQLSFAKGLLADVFLFVAQLDPDGRVVLAGDAGAYKQAILNIRAAGAVPWLTIVNDVCGPENKTVLKSAAIVHEVLTDSNRQNVHVQSILQLAQELDVSGIDIDYENLIPTDRNLFTSLITNLAFHAQHQGLLLAVTVQSKRRDSQSAGPGAMDWKALCQTVDRLQVMLYNEHNSRTKPGPIASISWIKQVMEYAVGQCPVAKLVPAFKVIGMEWGEHSFRDVPFELAAGLLSSSGAIMMRTHEDQIPYFGYVDRVSQESRTVFFEDATSLSSKLNRVRSYGISAAVLWSLSREDPQFWRSLPGIANDSRAPGKGDFAAR